MDHSRHLKRYRSSSKSKKSSKKKRSRDENGSGSDNKIVSVSSSVVKPLVEYSDVSSEDLSEPEAGEIQSEESPPFSDGLHHRKLSVDEDRDSYRHLPRKSVSHRVDSSILSHSPSPQNERKHSVSSDVSRSSSMRRKRHDSSPHNFSMHKVSSPSLDIDEYEYRKHRKKKEKKHKKDKKSSKKKKKKSKHRSRSSSVENVSGSSKSKHSLPDRNVEQLSDWEAPFPAVLVDQVTCSPISPASNHSSPGLGLGHDRINSFSPRSATPTQPPPKKFPLATSPHTPQLPPKAYEHSKIDLDDHCSNYSGRKQLSGSPILSDRHSISPPRIDDFHSSWGRHSLSPVKSSPFRNPSPDVQIIDMSPSRKKRRVEKEVPHRRHRKERERMKERRRMSRSRSPIMRRHRSSRSPSWGRSRHYSRSTSRTRTSKRYRSRSPKRIASPRSPPLRYLINYILL